MSTGHIPPRPTGTTREARFLQAVWDELFRGRLNSVPNALVKRTTRGDSVIPNSLASGGKNLVFKGQWVANKSYSKDEIVIRETDAEIDDGSKAGTYKAKINVPANSPAPNEEGGEVFWETFARGSWKNLVVTDKGSGVRLKLNATGGQVSFTDESGNLINLILEDCLGNEIRLNPVPTCEDDTQGYRIFVCSEFIEGAIPT
jgi:hypothetical protein